MKKILTLFALLLISVMAFAQNPKLSYQAVVRDSQNKLVVEQPVTVTVNVLKADNTSQFSQTLNATTNRNGLMSLEIGDETAAWNNIDWEGAKIRTAVTLSNGNQVIDTSNVNAVPLALQTIRPTGVIIPQSDWAETDNGKNTFILNKPSIADTVNNILSTGNYVTAAMMDARGYLTADSTVITMMQSNISTNANNISTNTNAIAAAVNKEQADSTTLATRIDALEGTGLSCNNIKTCIADTLSKYAQKDSICNIINNCDLSGNASLQTLLAGFSDQIDVMNAKIDSLEHIIDLLTFVCGTSMVKDIDGNKYATVQIGEQCWMAQNLRTKIGVTGDYEYPSDISTDSLLYGRMYSWDIATNSTAAEATDSKIQGICPAGWHIPTTTDINNIQGGVEALNLPKAGFYNTVSLSSFGTLGLIWTATTIENDGYNSVLGHSPKVYGYPVRCLKD